MKTVYIYDEVTGESLGPVDAHESPLELGVYIEPTCSTPIAPPALAVNQAAFYVNGAWLVVPDYRGQTVYDKTTGASSVITASGALPTGVRLTKTAAQRLTDAQAAQITTLASAYAIAIQQDVSFTTDAGSVNTYQANAMSVSNLQNTMAGLQRAAATPAGFYWVDANNMQVPFTYGDLQGLAAAMLTQGWPAFAHLQMQKIAIQAATTVSDAQAIVW